jgi:hypothetical protein
VTGSRLGTAAGPFALGRPCWRRLAGLAPKEALEAPGGVLVESFAEDRPQ